MDDTDNNPVDINTDDLDAFEQVFFNKNTPVAKEEEVDETPEDEDDLEVDDSEEGPEEDEVDTLASDDDDEAEEEEEEEEPAPKPKAKKSFQERINELTAKAKDAEREKDAVLKRLEELEAAVKEKKEEPKKEEKAVERPTFDPDAPDPDAVGEDGNPLYALGEFDPLFIRDLTRFTIQKEREAAKVQEAEELKQKEIEAAKTELLDEWTEKMEESEKEIPDLREKIATLDDTFSKLDPSYGEYLSTTIMSCEFGPEILYYFSQNIGEAQKIVAAGPAAATLAIGRLEARISAMGEKEEKSDKKAKVSKAPPPPTERARGTGGKFSVSADTDDLDAFEKEFFKRK